MNIPNYENTKFVEYDGNLTASWSLIMQQLLLELAQNAGQKGFEISKVSSDPASVSPPATGGQLAAIASTFVQPDDPTANQDGGVTAGLLVFDPYEVNGATPPARNGQLKVLLQDGAFHAIPNS